MTLTPSIIIIPSSIPLGVSSLGYQEFLLCPLVKDT